jgi:uncharacterized protein YceK
MKRAVAALLVLATCMGLCGCGSMLENEYYSEKQHKQNYELVEGNDALQAYDYSGLKSVMLYFVWNMLETGTIRLSNYMGDASEDIFAARTYIMKEDALGCYCVEDVILTLNQIVSYYEVTVQITYSHTPEEVKNISYPLPTRQTHTRRWRTL